MGSLRRATAATSGRVFAAACLLAGVGSVIGILILSHSASAPVIATPTPVEVTASFDRAFVQFGDRITARVVVALDTRRVLTRTLRVNHDLAPLTQLGRAHTVRSTQGGVEFVTFAVPVACLTAPCVASGGPTRIALPPVRVSVLARGGRSAHASVPWPALAVRGRVTASDLTPSTPPFQSDTAPPSVTYRIAPTILAILLDLVAALSALAAIALAAREVRLHLRRRESPPSALARALRLTRQAARRSVADRRRALSLLGRTLEGDQRSGTAGRLAWSEPAPEPSQLEELADEIDQRRPT